MINTTLPAKRAIGYIVKSYRTMQRRREHPLSYRDFAVALSAVLKPIGGNISHQTIKNWEHMEHMPNAFYIRQIALHSQHSWQLDFATDILAVLTPGEYQPATYIGRAARKELNGEMER